MNTLKLLYFFVELNIFNTAQGARKIWLKLQDTLHNSWRSICDDFRLNNFESYPPFFVFVAVLAKQVREYSDLLYEKFCCFWMFLLLNYFELLPKHLSKLRMLILPTMSNALNQPDPSTKTSNLSLSNKEVCPVHENADHSLHDCAKFAKLPHRDKINVLKRNGWCFFFLFWPPLSSRLHFKGKVRKRHATLLHFRN